MKKTLVITCMLLAASGLFCGGWYLGQRSTAKLAGEVLQMDIFNSAYTQASENDGVIVDLDSGRVDDAKYMLRLHLDGSILELDNILATNSNMSLADLKYLRELNQSIQSPYGSQREVADKILARIAQHRADYPWTYKGNLPQVTNTEVQAKLGAILMRASKSQKLKP